jgi:hypothetical protein
MTDQISLLDVVALTADIPKKSLLRGQVGTVVEIFADGLYADGLYEVEFSDDAGRTYALEALDGDALMVLRFQPEEAA